jgi:hypothetical protein
VEAAKETRIYPQPRCRRNRNEIRSSSEGDKTTAHSRQGYNPPKGPRNKGQKMKDKRTENLFKPTK